MKRTALAVLTTLLTLGAPGQAPADPACPVVTDAPGDAGRYPSPVAADPQAARAVDILSAGADASADTLEISIRVSDLAAVPLTPQRRYELWEVSWAGANGRRWHAYARRSAAGAFSFSYEWTSIEGPHVGHATTGNADLPTSTLAIDVPRSGANVPPDGGRLEDFTAEASVEKEIGTQPYTGDLGLPSESVGAAVTAYDETASGTYVVGTACSA